MASTALLRLAGSDEARAEELEYDAKFLRNVLPILSRETRKTIECIISDLDTSAGAIRNAALFGKARGDE